MDAAEIKYESAGERKISAPASLFQQEIFVLVFYDFFMQHHVHAVVTKSSHGTTHIQNTSIQLVLHL